MNGSSESCSRSDFFLLFFGTAAESVAEGGFPSGVPEAEDGAEVTTKMKNNFSEREQPFTRTPSLFSGEEFFQLITCFRTSVPSF